MHGSGKHNIRHTFPFVASSGSLSSVRMRLEMNNKPTVVEGLQWMVAYNVPTYSHVDLIVLLNSLCYEPKYCTNCSILLTRPFTNIFTPHMYSWCPASLLGLRTVRVVITNHHCNSCHCCHWDSRPRVCGTVYLSRGKKPQNEASWNKALDRLHRLSRPWYNKNILQIHVS